MLKQLAGVLGGAIGGIDVADLPAVFLAPAPRPLKLGIHKDMLEIFPAANPKPLGSWFRQWCGSWQYLRAIDAGAARFDLGGHEAGEVTAVDRAQARVRLERYRQKREGAAAPSAGSASSRPGRPILKLNFTKPTKGN